MTHLDAQSHVLYQGKVYNGFSKDEIGTAGANKPAVTSFREGFFGRGILMDIPKLKGVKYLELSTPIYPEDLDAWEKKAGIKVGSGDIVFIRTGRWSRRTEKGAWNTDQASAGLHVSCARWFKQRDVAVIGSDVHAELMPSPVAGIPYPMHQLFVVAMGMPMFDNCDLEPLSEAAAARNRWEFLLTASPLVVPRGTGSPLNPIAIFRPPSRTAGDTVGSAEAIPCAAERTRNCDLPLPHRPAPSPSPPTGENCPQFTSPSPAISACGILGQRIRQRPHIFILSTSSRASLACIGTNRSAANSRIAFR